MKQPNGIGNFKTDPISRMHPFRLKFTQAHFFCHSRETDNLSTSHRIFIPLCGADRRNATAGVIISCAISIVRRYFARNRKMENSAQDNQLRIYRPLLVALIYT